MLAWTKHSDVVQFFTPLVHNESRQHRDLFLKTQWFARSLASANQWKIERKNGRQTIAFSNKVHDVSPSNVRHWRQCVSRCVRENVPSIKYRILFSRERKTVAKLRSQWFFASYPRSWDTEKISFRIFSLLALRKCRTPSFLPCTTTRAFY